MPFQNAKQAMGRKRFDAVCHFQYKGRSGGQDRYSTGACLGDLTLLSQGGQFLLSARTKKGSDVFDCRGQTQLHEHTAQCQDIIELGARATKGICDRKSCQRILRWLLPAANAQSVLVSFGALRAACARRRTSRVGSGTSNHIHFLDAKEAHPKMDAIGGVGK